MPFPIIAAVMLASTAAQASSNAATKAPMLGGNKMDFSPQQGQQQQTLSDLFKQQQDQQIMPIQSSVPRF